MSFQSASSSSATACANAVPTCWPISAFSMCTVTIPPRSTVYQTVGEKLPAANASPALPVTPDSSEKPQVRPAPAVIVPIKNWRRFTSRTAFLRARIFAISRLLLAGGRAVHVLSGALDCLLDPDIGHAAAEIAVHRLDDLRVRGIGILAQEGCRLHDLARLAPAALRHLLGDPGALHRMLTVGIETFDGGHLAIGRVGERCLAGAHRLAIEVDRTGAAESRTTSELGAGHLQVLANNPEKRRIVGHFDHAP